MSSEAADDRVSTSRRRLNEARETDTLYSPRETGWSAETAPWESDGKEAGHCETKGSGCTEGSGGREIDQHHVASPPRERCASSGARPFVGRSPRHGDGTGVCAQSEIELDTAVGLDSNGDSELADSGRTAMRSSHGADYCDNICLSAKEGVERGAAARRPYRSEEESVRAVAEKFVGSLFDDCWSSTGARHSVSPSSQ